MMVSFCRTDGVMKGGIIILLDKSKKFSFMIIDLYLYMINKNEFVLSKQILRSGTSIGANVRENRNAQSEADFINKLSIALKEADETEYWLEVMEKSEIITIEQVESLNSDLSEIIAMLIKSIKTVKKKLELER